jgi:hypothetical protein
MRLDPNDDSWLKRCVIPSQLKSSGPQANQGPSARAQSHNELAEALQTQGIVAEGASGANPAEGRCRWTDLDGRADRRGISMPGSNNRESAKTSGNQGL